MRREEVVSRNPPAWQASDPWKLHKQIPCCLGSEWNPGNGAQLVRFVSGRPSWFHLQLNRWAMLASSACLHNSIWIAGSARERIRCGVMQSTAKMAKNIHKLWIINYRFPLQNVPTMRVESHLGLENRCCCYICEKQFLLQFRLTAGKIYPLSKSNFVIQLKSGCC